MTRRRTLATTVALASFAGLAIPAAAHGDPAPTAPSTTTPAANAASSANTVSPTNNGTTPAMFVSNNWDGTIDVLAGKGELKKVGRLNAIPDKSARLTAIAFNPVAWISFLYIRNTAGEGHDQFVDDTYSVNGGKAVVVSRPSFADVVSIDTATNKINWRFPMTGVRADHMALSPDGTRVAVSDSSAGLVHVIDVTTGKEAGRFKTGDKPHENVFSPDGKYIWNMAIGNVETGLDDPSQDWTKGDRHITIVDATTFQTVRTIDMRDRLNAFGRADLSDAVRPIAFTPDFTKAYFQVSFFNGFVEYDIESDKITRIKELPKNPALTPDRTKWVNDSRHHGLSMSPDGKKLCVAGTMDDYGMVVDREAFKTGPQIPTNKPYWATVSPDGNSCIMSEAGADQVTSISFATGEKQYSVPVGDHPQRVRVGEIPDGWVSPVK